MRGVVVRHYGVEEFCEKSLPSVGLVNLIVFGGAKGEDRDQLIKLSKQCYCTVAAGMDRKTLFVADCGDEITDVRKEKASAVGSKDQILSRVCTLSCGRVGFLTGADVLSSDTAKRLAEEGAHLLIALPFFANAKSITMARAHAVAHGVRLLYCAEDFGFAADFTGKATTFGGRVVSVECALVTEKETKEDASWSK